MYGLIYRIINKINGKLYVGQTVKTIEKRWDGHKRSSKTKDFPIYYAMRKYGIENFYIELLDIAQDQEELDLKEVYYSEFYDTMTPNGYNLIVGNGGGHISEEVKKRISTAHMGKKGHIPTQETRQKMSASHIGKKMPPRTPEHAEKIAVQNRGKIASPEFRQKMSEVTKGENNAFFGKTHTEESKNKISVANKGRKRTTPVSEAIRFKLSLVNRGRIPSEETRKKIGEKSKNREFTNNDAVICLNNNTIYTSITKAAKALSVDRHNVSDVCNGKREEIKGFKFRFIEDIQKEQSLSK